MLKTQIWLHRKRGLLMVVAVAVGAFFGAHVHSHGFFDG
jgi:hypothetical protein